MSNLRPESRIKSLERRATDIEAAIEELADDTAESSKALFQHVQQGFQQAHAYIQENIETVLKDHTSRLDHIDQRLDTIDSKLDRIITFLEKQGME